MEYANFHQREGPIPKVHAGGLHRRRQTLGPISRSRYFQKRAEGNNGSQWQILFLLT